MAAGEQYSYKQTEYDIFLDTYSPAATDSVTIYDFANVNDSLRDLFNTTTDPYIETGTPELYMQSIKDIDWEYPIESFTLPTANITIDGNASDWNNVPVFQFAGGFTFKIVAGNNNVYYALIYYPAGLDGSGDQCSININKSWPWWGVAAPTGDSYFSANMSINNFSNSVSFGGNETGTVAPTSLEIAANDKALIQINGKPVGLEVKFSQLDRLTEENYQNYFYLSWRLDGVYRYSWKQIKLYQ